MEYDMNHYKILFVRKLQELENAYVESSNFSLIDASNALRMLLLDSLPLVDLLNKEKQLPIRYSVNNDPWHEDSLEIALPILAWKEINPVFSSNPVDLKKDAFLKFTCIYFLKQPFTVQDVLKFYAYVRGGIHLDKGEAKYEPLREAFNTFQLNGLSALDYTMRGILQVVLLSLRKNKDVLLA
jgi:hypothetical protein